MNQEITLFRSLLGQAEMPQDVLTALNEMSTLVNTAKNCNLNFNQVPLLQGDMGQRKYSTC